MPEPSPTATMQPPPRTPIGPWLVLLATLVFFVAGSARLAPRLRLVAHADELRATSGVVTRSDVVEHGGRDYVTARVTVRYSVDGHEYILGTSGTDGRATPANSPDAFVVRHPVGARVALYYLPHSPQTSTLTRDVRIATDLGVLGVLAAVATALAASLLGRRRRIKNEVHNASGDAPAMTSTARLPERRSTDE